MEVGLNAVLYNGEKLGAGFNNVGCKAGGYKEYEGGLIGQALTMWDVKVSEIEILGVIEIGRL